MRLFIANLILGIKEESPLIKDYASWILILIGLSSLIFFLVYGVFFEGPKVLIPMILLGLLVLLGIGLKKG